MAVDDMCNYLNPLEKNIAPLQIDRVKKDYTCIVVYKTLQN